jgi:hypothetical protein
MRSLIIIALGIAVTLTPGLPMRAAVDDGSAGVAPALRARVEALLRRLDADDFAAREAASLELESLPPEALPMIEAALSTGAMSPEVALRLEAKVSLLRRKAVATVYENALRQEMDWSRTTALAAYDGGGHINPKWDAAAREAIVLQVRPRFDPNRSPTDDARIDAAIRKAIDLGCNDPFLLYVQANRYCQTPRSDPRKAREMMDTAADGVLAGNYPAVRKLMAAARRAETVCAVEPDPLPISDKRDLARDLATARSLLPAAAREGTPRGVVYEAAAALFTPCLRLHGGDRDKAFAEVDAALRAAVPGTNLPARFAADVYLTRAESVRADRDPPGQRVSSTEKPKLLAELGAKAAAAIDAALAIDPQDPVALNQKLRLLSHLQAPRDEFDTWFDKAMAAYPNNLSACKIKRLYLSRQSRAMDDVIAFGRECLAGGNWSSRIPLIAVEAHTSIARFDRPEEHFGRDEVWQDVRAAEEGYLKRYPKSVYDRTLYAELACYAGQWDIAKAQFDLLAEDGVHSVFRGKQTYDYYRKKADRLTAAATRQP